MKGTAIGGVVAFLVICLAAFFFLKSKKKSSPMDTKRKLKGEQKPQELEDELRDLRYRIGNAHEEGYKMYEGYMAPGNPGLTVAGTIIECMLDVAIGILAQENSRKVAKGFIKDEKDAEVVATGIRAFTDDALRLIENTNFITCDGQGEDPCKKARVNPGAIESVIQNLIDRSVGKTLVTDDMLDSSANIIIEQQKRMGVQDPHEKEMLVSRMKREWDTFSSKDAGSPIEEPIERD
jgi:hypothetical protein